MKISEHANYLLNEFGRLQFDYAAYCKPYGESLRNEARNNLETYIAELEAQLAEEVKYEINEKVRKGKSICEACGGDGSLLLTDGYKGQVVATVECIYCNGTGYVDESPNDTQTDTVVYGKDSD